MTGIPASCFAPSAAKDTCLAQERPTVFSSVRARLTLWYVSVLALVLVAFSIAGYLLLARSLYPRLDARLVPTLEATVSALKPALSKPGNDSIQRTLDDLRFPNQTVGVLDASQRVIAQKIAPGGLPLRLPP